MSKDMQSIRHNFPAPLTAACGFADQRPSVPRVSQRRGVIFVTALWVMLILGVLVLMFARAMRTEVIASQTRAGGEQVDAIVEAGIQYALGVCDAYAPANTVSNTPGDSLSIVQSPGEAMQVGNAGYFWFIHSNPDDL